MKQTNSELKIRRKIKKVDIDEYKRLQGKRILTLRRALQMHKVKDDGSQDMLDDVYLEYREFQDKYRKTIDELAIIEIRIKYTKLLQKREKIVSKMPERDIEEQPQSQKKKTENLQRKLKRLYADIRRVEKQVKEPIIPIEDLKTVTQERKEKLEELSKSYAIFRIWENQIKNQFFKFEYVHGLIEALNELGAGITYNPSGMNYKVSQVQLEEFLKETPLIDMATISEVLDGYQNYSLGDEYDKEKPTTIKENNLWKMPEELQIRQYQVELEGKIKNPEFWERKRNKQWKYEYNQKTPSKHFGWLYTFMTKSAGIIEKNILQLLYNIKGIKQVGLLGAPKTNQKQIVNLLLKELVEDEKINGEMGFIESSALIQLSEKYPLEDKNRKQKMQQDLREWVTNWYLSKGINIPRDGAKETDNQYVNRLIRYVLYDLENITLEQLNAQSNLKEGKDDRLGRKKRVHIDGIEVDTSNFDFTPLGNSDVELDGEGQQVLYEKEQE